LYGIYKNVYTNLWCIQFMHAVILAVGYDVTLPCQAADYPIGVVEWSRADLAPEYILYYSDGHLDPTYQHPDFKDRVELVDRDLKDGDTSLILKNVSSIDNGTYECVVTSAGSRRKKRDTDPINTIQLQVTEPVSGSLKTFYSSKGYATQNNNVSPLNLHLTVVSVYLSLGSVLTGALRSSKVSHDELVQRRVRLKEIHFKLTLLQEN
uniref:Ig-like domain-containing protein n=1 Tax=Sander lucioperca TaxID=283035 RepID=A0A8D0A0D8_SANLU